MKDGRETPVKKDVAAQKPDQNISPFTRCSNRFSPEIVATPDAIAPAGWAVNRRGPASVEA